jgi:hypothetical protein
MIRPDSRAAALLADLGAVAEEIGRLRWTLAQVIAVADDAPGITDEELQARLVALAPDGAESDGDLGGRAVAADWRHERRPEAVTGTAGRSACRGSQRCFRSERGRPVPVAGGRDR